jgi:hypothetical protein
MSDEVPPPGYLLLDAVVMTNYDHTIDPVLASRLFREPVVMEYAAWYFYGLVWYSPEREMYYCQISRHYVAVGTLSAPTLVEIMSEACDKYGSD